MRVRDPAKRDRIAEHSGGQERIRTAPAFFVVCLDTYRLRRLLESRGQPLGMKPLASLLFGITNAATLAHSMAIAAEAMGLGTCFVGGLRNQCP